MFSGNIRKRVIYLFSTAGKLHVHTYWNNWLNHAFLNRSYSAFKIQERVAQMRKTGVHFRLSVGKQNKTNPTNKDADAERQKARSS